MLLVHTLGYLLPWKSICECQCIKAFTGKDISTSKLLPCTIFHLFSLCSRVGSIYLFQGKQAAGSGEEAIWAFLPSLLHSEKTGTCGHQDKQLQGTALSLAVPPGIKSGLGDMLRHFSLNKMTRGRHIKQQSCILTSSSHRGASPNSPQERTPSAIAKLEGNKD